MCILALALVSSNFWDPRSPFSQVRRIGIPLGKWGPHTFLVLYLLIHLIPTFITSYVHKSIRSSYVNVTEGLSPTLESNTLQNKDNLCHSSIPSHYSCYPGELMNIIYKSDDGVYSTTAALSYALG